MRKIRSALFVLFAVLAVSIVLPASASAGDGNKSKQKRAWEEKLEADPEAKEVFEQMKALKKWTKAHVQLGHQFMRDGKYAEAAAHFDTVLMLEVDPAFEAKLKETHERLRGDKGKDKGDGIFAGKGKRGKRGKRAKHAKKKLKLYAASARAHALAGDEATALTRIDEGIAAAEKAGAKKIVKRLEKLREDPAKLGKDPEKRDTSELEAQIRDAEKHLPLAP